MDQQVPHLPLQKFGLNNIPAVPYVLTLTEPLATVLRLALRAYETRSAKDGLSVTYTIGNRTATAFEFLYGGHPSHPLLGVDTEIERVMKDRPEKFLERIKTARPKVPDSTAGQSPIPSLPLEK